MAENTTMDREFGWDDHIEKDNNEFITLPEGDYDFTVESFDRGRHNGSEKLPPCNKAILHIRIEAPEGEVYLTHNLFLHSRVEGLLSAFFISIGLKKKGEVLRMNWQAVPGCKGRLKLGSGITKKMGRTGQSMRLNSFIRKRHQNTLRGDSDEAADEITALPEGGKGSDLSGVG